MKSTPYAAFGNVLFVVESENDTIVQDTSSQKPVAEWRYIIQGNVYSTGADGSVITFAERSVAFNSSLPENRVINISPNSKWICIHKSFDTVAEYPDVITLNPGDTLDIAQNSNVFLAEGIVSFDSKTVTGPYQLRVRTKAITLTAETECLLISFK